MGTGGPGLIRPLLFLLNRITGLNKIYEPGGPGSPMPVISISLPEPLLKQLDQAIAREGFSGRSEALRAAVRALVQRARERPATGRISAVLSLTYPEEAEGEISALLHRSAGLIESMVHTHTPGRKCVTVLVLSGDAGRLRELAGGLEGRRDVETVEFQPLGP